jgi:hypothetical protein
MKTTPAERAALIVECRKAGIATNGMTARDMRRALENVRAIPAEELDPRYTFQGTRSALLVRLVNGDIDPRALIVDELANRGLHPSTGQWVGFDVAKLAAADWKAREGIL